MNPELLRNLWLQFSPARLVSAPLIIGAVLALTALGADGDWNIVGQTAHFGFAIIAYLWGTRRSVSVLTDEIVAGTWDGQRMSAIGPWSMAWGKVIGGAAYVWYCASLCLLIYAVAELKSGRSGELPIQLSLDLSGALLVQVIALLLALVLVRKGHRIGRRSVAFAQGGALLIALLGVSETLLPTFLENFEFGGIERTTWFGMTFSVDEFTLLTQLLFLGWAIVGAYRLMASELQVRQYPSMWITFSLFLIAYYQGFILTHWDGGHLPRVLAALAVAVPLVYVAVFAQTNEVVRYRWLFHHLSGRTARNALSLVPLWMPSIIVAAGLAIAAGLLAGNEPELTLFGDRPVTDRLEAEVWAGGLPSAIALILFMLRDLGLVLYLNFAARPKAPDLTAAVYLVVLYVVCGGLVVAAGAGSLLAVFLPGAGTDPVLVVIAPLVQVALVAILLLRRWRWHARALQLRPAA
jgi:hypothetical protein